jgi:hypothetical protein
MRAPILLSLFLAGCVYDEECRDVVVPNQNAPQLLLERCGLHTCAVVLDPVARKLRFRLPSEPGRYRLEDLRAEQCVDDECMPVTGSIDVRAATSPAEHRPVGKLEADAVVDAPSTFAGPQTWRYDERWDKTCYDVDWPDMSRIF